jgi:Flp pilus assembly protein TadD
VDKVSLKRRTLIVGLAACVGLGWLTPAPCSAQGTYGSTSAPKTSIIGSIKQGFSKVGDFFVPKSNNKQQTPADDAISLKSQSKPGPELYAAIARLYEESGKNAEAEQYYQMALKEKADDITALLGYAHFQENQGRINEAVALYQKAVQTHPKEAGAYNNLGLCYARRNKLNEAAAALGQAAQLDPRNPLYRNNLASVLVEQNRLPEAFANLREAHGDAAANYNLGYLLNKKGNTEAAEHYFAQALRVDPTMAPAQKWLNYLQNKSRESALGGRSNDGSVRVGSLPSSSQFPAKVISPPASATPSPVSYSSQNPMVAPAPNTTARLPSPVSGFGYSGKSQDGTVISPQQPDKPPLPPAIRSPQRLPPVSLSQPAGTMEIPQGIPNSSESNLAAPLPPGTR